MSTFYISVFTQPFKQTKKYCPFPALFSLGPCSAFQHSAQISRFCLQLFAGRVGEQRKNDLLSLLQRGGETTTESFWSRCSLCQGLSGEMRTKPPVSSTDMPRRRLSSPRSVVSASSAVKEVRTGKFKYMLFKTSSVYCLLACRGCTRRQSFPRIFAEVVQNPFPPPPLSWNFNFGQKGIFR